MSLTEKIRDCLTRGATSKRHLLRHIPVEQLAAVKMYAGGLPEDLELVATEFGVVNLFLENAEYPNYLMGFCYDLEFVTIMRDQTFLKIGYWRGSGAVYRKWERQARVYLPGVYGLRGGGMGRHADSLEDWFDLTLRKVRKYFPKRQWLGELGMEEIAK